MNNWSATPDGSNYYNVNLNNGNVNSNNPSNTNYASCVSGQHKESIRSHLIKVKTLLYGEVIVITVIG